jgi:glycosyltransferase involved in cell wall biosynthesis
MILADRLKRKLVQGKIWLKWQIMDLVRTKGVRWISRGYLLKYILLKRIIHRINLVHLFAAHRYYPTEFISKCVSKEMQLVAGRVDNLVDIVQIDQLSRAAYRTIVLKNPDVQKTRIEKGVLLVTFTETFPFFYNHVNCDELLNYFYVVLEPSWAGYCDPNVLFWARYKPHPVTVQATEIADFRFLQTLKSNLVPVSFGASDWVDFRIFQPLPGMKKEYDAIYVTNYNPIKRHHILFKALKGMRSPNYKVALVFGRNGDAKSEIEHLIAHYNVSRNVSIYESLSQHQLNEILNMSKVNLLLSLKEGSNRSIFEAFFANVPGIVLRNNMGVNKDYINEMTGQLIEEKELIKSLLYFKTNWAEYNPLKWALDNISPLVTTRKLSLCLQKIAEDRGELWTREIVPKVNAPEVNYFYQEDKRSMLDSHTVLSLFLKTNFQRIKTEQVLQNHCKLRGGSGNSDSVISGSLASRTPPGGGEPKELGNEADETESRSDL